MTAHPKETYDYENKVAVITGGSRNIGKMVAIELVKKGAKVVIGDLLDKEGQNTIQELNLMAKQQAAVYLHTDVAKYSDLIALFQLAESTFGGVDIAFLNAGITMDHDLLLDPLDDEQDVKLMNVNTMGVIKGTKVAVRHLVKRGGGVIVATSSGLGLESFSYSSIYNASKHAIVGWVRSFEHLPRVCNIRINAVCPHAVETDLSKDFPEPMFKLVKSIGCENTRIETVVKAVLLLIEDKNRNAQTLTALPNDIIELEEPPKIVAKGKLHFSI
ncbi:hypothetical protein BDA99DRAFT_503260 [Phascolomyces articulosus]|uniref:Uncharacterized protein n=1 Tax=Phascolomyces articulosus TaxID=60185 RepID=A0AAD5KEZ1_9FUNG|nr:hypothetical protein BDA99DRAFT_503260 [Phascolomyces articulosus]